MLEMLDIVDDNGEPTGKIIERNKAHELGILHRTSHVWIVRNKNNHLQVLLQKRSDDKDSYPGCYDISSAGHIPAGDDYIVSALRELKEELGYAAQQEDLIYCGTHHFQFYEIFHQKPFHDHQISRIYALWLDLEPEKFVLQKEEVSEVRWFDFDDCLNKVKNNLFPHCIYLEELEMLFQKISTNCDKNEE